VYYRDKFFSFQPTKRQTTSNSRKDSFFLSLHPSRTKSRELIRTFEKNQTLVFVRSGEEETRDAFLPLAVSGASYRLSTHVDYSTSAWSQTDFSSRFVYQRVFVFFVLIQRCFHRFRLVWRWSPSNLRRSMLLTTSTQRNEPVRFIVNSWSNYLEVLASRLRYNVVL